MILNTDRLQIELSLMNYRNKGYTGLRLFYDIISGIAEEVNRHFEVVSYTINLLILGTLKGSYPIQIPLKEATYEINSQIGKPCFQ